MLWGLSFIFLFTIGGLTGLFLGMLAVDVHLHDTYFVVAHFHYVMVGGTVIGFIGGLHYWWPKMFGKMYDERLAKIAFAFVFTGFNMTFLTQFVLGSQGMPRRYYDYLDQYQPLHGFSSIGAYVLGLGFVIMAVMFIKSLLSGPKAPPNPWGSAGFEWQTASPPIEHNFHHTPVVDRGPYDYHLATEEELFDGFPDELPEAARTTRAHVSELGSDVSDEVSTKRAVVEGVAPEDADGDTGVSEATSSERYADDDEGENTYAGEPESDEDERGDEDE
jgi:cytochrome c oxidase subunit 1